MCAVVKMPFLALSAALTSDSAERGSLAGIRVIAGAGGGLFGAIMTLKLVNFLGGGQTGFFWTAIIYGLLATAILLVVFKNTCEVVDAIKEHRPSARDIITMLRSNRAFWVVSTAMLLGSISITFFQKTLPYFMKCRLDREDLIGPALGLLALSVMVSIPMLTMVMKRTSKRIMWITGAFVGWSGSALLWVLPEAPETVLISLIFAGFGSGAAFLGFWSMMPDTVEYGEWHSGIRAEGAVFGLAAFMQKASLGLAAAALGEILSTIGYHLAEAEDADGDRVGEQEYRSDEGRLAVIG